MSRKRRTTTQESVTHTVAPEMITAVYALLRNFVEECLPATTYQAAWHAAERDPWQIPTERHVLVRVALLVARNDPQMAEWIVIEPSTLRTDAEHRYSLARVDPRYTVRGAVLRALLLLGAPRAAALRWAHAARRPTNPFQPAAVPGSRALPTATTDHTTLYLTHVATQFDKECAMEPAMLQVLYGLRRRVLFDVLDQAGH